MVVTRLILAPTTEENAIETDIINPMADSSTTFDQLFEVLKSRVSERPEGSSTVAALDQGIHAIGKKVIEEAGEVWLAAEHGSDDELAEEISQLLYWLQVTMISRDIELDDIYRYL